MGLGDLLKRAADAVVQGAVVSYYFVYYLVKGHENEEANQQHLCIDGKPVRGGAQSPPTTAAQNANVCCLHGVQAKPGQIGNAPPPPPPPFPRKPEPPAAPQNPQGVSGLLSWLNPKNWFSKQESKEKVEHDRPIVPPRHFKPSNDQVPNGAHSEGQPEQGQSLVGKLWSYVPSLGKGADQSAEAERPPSPIITHRILKVVTVPGPGTSDHLQFPVQSSEERAQSDFIRELKHAIEPHYPATFPHDQDPYKPTISVRSGVEYAQPAPPPPPPTKAGQSSVQIHIKPQPPPAAKPDDSWFPSEVQRPAVWAPSSTQPQPHAASSVQVQMQRQQLRKTATTTETRPVVSPTPYEPPDDQQKSVRALKRQWPPPSNATGVEIVKDLVFPSGAPGDLSSAIVADGDTHFSYEAYRPPTTGETSTRTTYDERRVREHSGGQQDYPEARRDNERSAISPERFRELSQELTSKSSAGKGVEMFVRRRQKVENWMNEEEQQQQRPAVPSSVQRMVPVAAPRKRVSANEVVDSVVEAASRKEHHWQPSIEPSRPEVSSPTRRELERVVSPTPPAPSWRSHERHERFFSPQPFSSGGQAPSRERLFTPPPRTHEPKVQQQAYRSMSVLGDRMEQTEFIDWKSGPETTTTVVSASTPSASRTLTKSTYAASRGSQYTKTSSYNTLPRTWKSYSDAYHQTH